MRNSYKYWLFPLILASILLVNGCGIINLLAGETPPKLTYSLVAEWGGYGNEAGKFLYPYAIAISNTNNVFVLDLSKNSIEKFNSNGEFISSTAYTRDWTTGVYSGVAMAVDPLENIFIVDRSLGYCKIKKLDKNGNLLSSWGDYGTGEAELYYIVAIAIQDNKVYLTDSFSSRVQIFDVSGNHILTWGKQGSNEGEMTYPKGLAVNSKGNVYICDNYNNRIQIFGSEGEFISAFGQVGTLEGEFYYPTHITIDQLDCVYVVDYYNNRIQKFDQNGHFMCEWDAPRDGIAVNSLGEVFVLSRYIEKIEKYAPNQ